VNKAKTLPRKIQEKESMLRNKSVLIVWGLVGLICLGFYAYYVVGTYSSTPISSEYYNVSSHEVQMQKLKLRCKTDFSSNADECMEVANSLYGNNVA
jgi:hypothetical protein